MALPIRSGIKNLACVVLLMLVVGGACRQVAAQTLQGDTLTIHVRSTDSSLAAAPHTSTDGKSMATGSLSEAVQLARRLRLRKPAPRVSIELEPGIHRLPEPLQLTAADSGTREAPLIIRGPQSGGAIIRGSIRVAPTGLASRDRRFGRLPSVARNSALLYVLPTDIGRPSRADIPRTHDASEGLTAFEVFDDTGPLRPARWPNNGWARGRREALGSIFFGAVEYQDAWRREPDLWIGGYFRWDWAFETIRLASDAAGRGFVPAKAPEFGIAHDFRAYVYHALSELDAPGGNGTRTRRRHVSSPGRARMRRVPRSKYQSRQT